MRSYVLVASIVFDIVFALQLARLLVGWPVRVGDVSVPLWPSAIAAVLAGFMAVWGLRLYLRHRGPGPAGAT